MEDTQNFCQGCLFIFKNIYSINSQSDSSEMIKPFDLTSSKNNCQFCLGVFNTNIYPYIIDKVKKQIISIEFVDYKIYTNFTPLFSLIHQYVYIIYVVEI